MSEEQLVPPPAEQSTPSVRAGRGGSNTRALVVAGLTVLATVLVAGQAFTAYTVYQHSEKLSMLERRSVRLQEMSVRATVNRTPMKMSMPMSSFPLLMPLDAKEPEPTAAPPKAPMTQCQQAAAGLIPSFLPSYRPQCDELGSYKPEQCWKEAVKCWCVDKDGSPLPGTMVNGHANCNTATE